MTSQTVRRTTLANGIHVLVEEIPTVRSVAIGIWVATGSRNETEQYKGISHFLEHMIFKGTKRRDAQEIASFLESVGGHLDAFTSRELTCFCARVLDEYVGQAVDILGDIVCNSVFAQEEIEKEKKVITEEIMNFEDNPDELIHDLFARAVWPNHSLGDPILGTLDTVSSFDTRALADYFRTFYGAPYVVITAAGNLSLERLVSDLERHITLPGDLVEQHTHVPAEQESGGIEYYERSLAQQYLCVGARGVSYHDPGRYPLLILSTLLGGGMSSRLFQKVREKQALAYAVYTYADFHRDTGLFGTFLGVRPEQAERALSAVLEEYRIVSEQEIEPRELESAKAQLKGGLLMGLEGMYNRMTRLAKNRLYYGRVIPIDELVASIESVSAEQVMETARNMLRSEKLLAVSLGSVKPGQLKVA
jgi:predicted Zn-dependent peptidase